MTNDFKGAPYHKIPMGKRSNPVQRDLHEVRQIDGSHKLVEVPEIESRHICEDWFLRSWYLLRTINKPQPPSRPRLDQLAWAELNALNVPCVMPVRKLSVLKRLPNGRKSKEKEPVSCLLFPGYLFVSPDLNDELFHAITACRHVGNFLNYDNRPIRIAQRFMKRLFLRLNDGAFDQDRGNLSRHDSPQQGELARITDGVFEDLTGTVEEFVVKGDPDKPIYTHAFLDVMMFNSRRRVKIDIDLLVREAVAK